MFDNVKAAIEQAGFGRKAIMRRYISTFSKSNLEADESLLVVAAPHNKPTKLLFVTDKKVCFYHMASQDDNDNRKVPYEDIVSCEIHKDADLAKITIETNSDDIILNSVPEKVAGEVEKTVEGLLGKK